MPTKLQEVLAGVYNEDDLLYNEDMPTVAEEFDLQHDPEGRKSKPYERHCPSCGSRYTNSKAALRCWYLHPEEDGGGLILADTPIQKIATILGVSPDSIRRSWRYLVTEFNAPARTAGVQLEPGENYVQVVHELRRQRQKRRALARGWSQRLASELGVSRQRISQLRTQALSRGDI